MVFPELDSEYRVETAGDANAGRGLTIQNLHCSEVARWGANAPEVLASLRAAVPPDGEIVLESTANGMGGCFYREWQRANETGYVRHFFPWWMDEGYRIDGRAAEELMEDELSAEEQRLMESVGLEPGADRFPAAGADRLWRTRGGGICRGSGDLLPGQRRGGV